MSDFATIFRASKIGAFNPIVKQVYTSRPKRIKKGEWGLKRDLSVNWKSSAIQIKNLDGISGFTDFKSSLHNILLIKRFVKNFGNTISWEGVIKESLIDLNKISTLDFKVLISNAKNKKEEWKNEKENKKILEFLKIDTSTIPVSYNAPPSYKIDRFDKIKVKGRIFETIKSKHSFDQIVFSNKPEELKYCIGVNGLICKFATRIADFSRGSLKSSQQQPYKLREFFVAEVYFKDNVPEIRLSLSNPQEISEVYDNHKSALKIENMAKCTSYIDDSTKDYHTLTFDL